MQWRRNRRLDDAAMERIDAPALGTILSVWAHPDDETYLAGGIMAAAANAGQRVVCVSATAGEHGTPDAVTWPPERLGMVRRWEAAAAMAVLGVDDHRFLGLCDGSLASIDPEVGVALVGELLDDVRPDTILTFGPDGITGHPDHVTISRWTTEAWHRRGHPGRLLHATMTTDHLARFGELYEQWGMYMTDERPPGVPLEALALHLVLDGTALDRKLTALAAMASQTRDVMNGTDPAVYASDVAEEAFVRACGGNMT